MYESKQAKLKRNVKSSFSKASSTDETWQLGKRKVTPLVFSLRFSCCRPKRERDSARDEAQHQPIPQNQVFQNDDFSTQVSRHSSKFPRLFATAARKHLRFHVFHYLHHHRRAFVTCEMIKCICVT